MESFIYVVDISIQDKFLGVFKIILGIIGKKF